MATYFVIASDGQRYGPVDEPGLLAWAREGRVVRDTHIFCQETNVTAPAFSFPTLASTLGPAPTQAPVAPSQPVGYYSGAPIFPNGHELSDFPVVGIVLLDIFVPIFSVIWFNLMHGKMNRNRPDDPGAGKAIGFCFIPLFNIWYWDFFTFRRLVLRVNEQRTDHGLPPADLDGLALTTCVLYACIIPIGCIPILNILLILAIKVISCIFFAKLQQAVNELVIQTRMRGFAPTMGGVNAR
jgi:hypothetical protein